MIPLSEYHATLPGGFPTTVLLDEATAKARGLKPVANKSRTPANKSKVPVE